jgi:hypothetical protein
MRILVFMMRGMTQGATIMSIRKTMLAQTERKNDTNIK